MEGIFRVCFDATFKLKNPEDTIIKVNVYAPELEVSCEDIKPYEHDRHDQKPGNHDRFDHPKCHPAKDTPDVSLQATARFTEKKKGKAVASKCISLAKYDDHDARNHFHVCGKKIEVFDSAWLPEIVTDYEVLECKYGSKKHCKVILSGNQECVWTGDFNEKKCQPERDEPFICPEDNIFKPYKKVVRQSGHGTCKALYLRQDRLSDDLYKY